MKRTRPEATDQDLPVIMVSRVIFATLLLSIFGILIWQGRRWVTLPETQTLLVYCFSGMQEVMEDAIFPSFQRQWSKESGGRMEFVATFAGSGEVTRKILNQFPAEVAILASEMDAARIASGDAGTLPHQGILARTPIVIAVREGNHKGIGDFGDLEKQGVGIVLPDPPTSGDGQWSLLAVFGASLRENGNRGEAWRRLDRVEANVVSWPPSIREAIEQFRNGLGDALVVYEASMKSGRNNRTSSLQLVYPRSSILCEPRALTVQANIKPEQRELAERFVQYLWSETAQDAFSRYGFYRSEAGTALKVETSIADPFRLADLGGAGPARMEIIDPFLKKGIVGHSSRPKRKSK